jgi:hypothetical protein
MAEPDVAGAAVVVAVAVAVIAADAVVFAGAEPDALGALPLAAPPGSSPQPTTNIATNVIDRARITFSSPNSGSLGRRAP